MTTVTRYKVWEWVDMTDYPSHFDKAFDIIYGIAAKVDKRWLPVRNGDNPLFFQTRDAAQEFVNKLNNPVKQHGK